MKKKTYITRTVKVASFLLAVFVSVALMNTYFLRRLDNNSTRLRGYYQESSQPLDVVFIGASDIYTCFPAGYAYEKFGFTSYPYASESITADGTLTALKEVLRTRRPKLIMIEVNAFLYGTAANEQHEGHVRKLTDNLPLNENKIEYVNLCAGDQDKLEYYLPLIKYHSLWEEYPQPLRMAFSTISQDVRGYSYLKGFRTTTDVYHSKETIRNDELASDNVSYPLNEELEGKLRKLLTYCKEQKLDNVVFFRSPHLVYRKTINRARRTNRAGEIVNSYGYDFLNLERAVKDIGLEPKTDFYNFDHMNIRGAEKFTDYLGDILQSRYGIAPTKLNAEQKAHWDEAATYYRKLRGYCEDLLRNKKVIKVEEDINTLRALEKY